MIVNDVQAALATQFIERFRLAIAALEAQPPFEPREFDIDGVRRMQHDLEAQLKAYRARRPRLEMAEATGYKSH